MVTSMTRSSNGAQTWLISSSYLRLPRPAGATIPAVLGDQEVAVLDVPVPDFDQRLAAFGSSAFSALRPGQQSVLLKYAASHLATPDVASRCRPVRARPCWRY